MLRYLESKEHQIICKLKATQNHEAKAKQKLVKALMGQGPS